MGNYSGNHPRYSKKGDEKYDAEEIEAADVQELAKAKQKNTIGYIIIIAEHKQKQKLVKERWKIRQKMETDPF